MTSRQVAYVSGTGSGPYHPARVRRLRGWTVVDTRTGRPAWTYPNHVTGGRRVATVPTLARAQAIAADLAAQDAMPR